MLARWYDVMGHDTTYVPTPIRKYYRARLSDGDQHMPGTLAPELNALIENGELKENHVLQVLEFGVYTIHGCAGVHVMKAVVVTTTPSYVFGDPIPLEEATSDNAVDAEEDHADGTTTGTNVKQHGLQNLYMCRCPVSVDASDCRVENRIPRTGWQVDDHGLEPAPECTWIPAAAPATTSANTTTLAAPPTSHSDFGNTASVVRTISVQKNGNGLPGSSSNSISPRTVVTTEPTS